MDLVDLIIGRALRRPTAAPPDGLPRIAQAPERVTWIHVRARGAPRTVRARLAQRDGVLNTARGRARYRAGHHYIVDYGGGDRNVARRDVFERVYEKVGDNRFAKRPEIAYRYFILPYDAVIVTAEGEERAKAGDWIMEDVMGGLYPISPERARDIYQTL